MSVILHSGGYDSKVSSLSRAWAAEQDPVSQKVEKKEGRKKAKGKEVKRSEGEGREKERKKGREGKGRKGRGLVLRTLRNSQLQPDRG
jgi:hypothetical protein